MRQILFALLLITSFNQIQAGGIDFFHGSWEEALEQAKSQDKLIFVDAYTTWCGPCKKMARNVFTDASVGEFYNKKIVPIVFSPIAPRGEKTLSNLQDVLQALNTNIIAPVLLHKSEVDFDKSPNGIVLELISMLKSVQ